MGISAKVNAEFLIDNKTYKASLNIPNSAPTADKPFIFTVTSKGEAADAVLQTLLEVAVGATDQVYVAVAPPMDLISEAIGGDAKVVQALNVEVSEGKYKDGKFEVKA
ncbi:hypothetical protein [Pseudomonas palmensis]